MFQWKRIIADKTAGQNSADTTETQIGSGIAVPNWANSIQQAIMSLNLLAVTNAESVSGYWKITNDENTIEPLNYPLPLSGAIVLSAAGESHLCQPITAPVLADVTPKDTVRVYAAFDVATTGVHLFDAWLLFSSESAGMSRMHIQKCAATAMGDALTDGTEVSISTLAGKTGPLIGMWLYEVSSGTMVTSEGLAGHVTVTSNAAGWQTMQLPLNMEPSGTGADIATLSMPVLYATPDMFPYWDGVYKRLWPQPFPVGDVQSFTFMPYNNRDIDNNIDPIFRAGLMWRE